MTYKRKFNDVECEALIAEVQTRPSLWDDKHENFKKTSYTRKLWKEIGNAVEMPGDDCRKKWKNLKDTYRKCLQIPKQKAGADFKHPLKKWKFQTQLEFIRDIVLPGSAVKNVTFPKEEDDDEETEEEKEENVTGADAEVVENDIDLLKTTPFCSADDETLSRPRRGKINPRQNEDDETFSRSRRDKINPRQNEDDEKVSRPRRDNKNPRQNEDSPKRMKKPEGKKFDTISNMRKQNNDTDDDHHFFLSLIPYLKGLDVLEKLQLRSKIHNCVLEAVKEHESREALQ